MIVILRTKAGIKMSVHHTISSIKRHGGLDRFILEKKKEGCKIIGIQYR